MNKIVCTFKDGGTCTFTTEDRATALGWFNSLWRVEDVVGVQLIVEGYQVFEKSIYRNAV